MDPIVREANEYATDNRRFEFVKKLGKGSFGTVLLAHDKQNSGRKVAIKCIETGRREKGLLAYLIKWIFNQQNPKTEASKEADLLLELQHPGIIGFLKTYEYEDAHNTVLAIVTDFCENGDLYNYLSQGYCLEPVDRLHWYQQLANGLNYIHRKGIVHRDIKPENILISCGETPKIADVGLAKPLYDIQNPNKNEFQEYMTSQAGTPPFMAPEVFEGHYEKKCDVFSLGLVFVTIVEVPPPHTPWPVATWNEIKDPLGKMYYENTDTRHLKPSHLLQLTKETPDEMKLFDGMLVYDRHKRYNAEEVLEEVKRTKSLASKFLKDLNKQQLRSEPQTPPPVCLVHSEPQPRAPSSKCCC